jgi:hypothetical protein
MTKSRLALVTPAVANRTVTPVRRSLIVLATAKPSVVGGRSRICHLA